MSRHLETCGCPVCQGVDKPIMRMNPDPPRFIEVPTGPKRLLIVYDQNFFRRDQIATLCDWMIHRGFNVWALPHYGSGGPDIRIFDLDGAPAPDAGLIRELIAGVTKPKTVWTPGGEFIPLEDACSECEGAGQVTTDRATCLTCGGNGRKKQVASA